MSAVSNYANEMAPRMTTRVGSWAPFRSAPKSLWARMQEQLTVWRERAITRRSLGQMGEHLQRDVGLGRAEIRRELRKPFWVD